MEIKHDKFVEDDEGAVTVDWVVLCALVVALAALATARVSTSAEKVGDYISTSIAE
jgi:hypothetical protein